MTSGSTVPLKRNLSSTSDSDRAESGRVNPPHEPLTPPASSPPREPPSVSQEVGPEVARHVYLECAQKAHPDITPMDDFEILMLGGSDLKGCTTVAEKRGWLAARRTALAEALGSAEAVLQGAKQMLDRTIETSGRKPDPGDPNVYMLPIHGSDYTMRMWPGSFARSEHCLDFIETKTGKAINAPDDYSIWFMPDPSAPWLQGAGPVELVSLERSFGMQPADIPEGEEKLSSTFCIVISKRIVVSSCTKLNFSGSGVIAVARG
ncbi:uncharacterized protein TRAVEDRAFT_17592 [Trametes versicolor FP-101664 SS1]|uniref:uncharacterized protein n=1 Tax=Trametes versicolor (strain FP-101664) TaxID=717944 RepID=UPI0004622CF5|nr:uncharacterized protein TRAVEDRAFT_17592 [Trametes versicolor FP-101664 SS1]EIW63137.1 hypothetical protein TRAVEDRAFT_17592 [Trametes versicolor FP-101664 SS1]